jgi:hypothetical protein
MKPVGSVEQNGRVVTLSNKTRTFMVYRGAKLGRHSEIAHETVGPRYDGLIVQATVQDGRYAGAGHRPLHQARIAEGRFRILCGLELGRRRWQA